MNQISIKKSINTKSLKSDKNTNDKDNSSKENTNDEENSKKSLKKQRTDISYDFSCLQMDGDRGTNKIITNAGDYLRAVQKQLVSNVEISIDEEKKYGDELVSEFKKKYEFVSSGKEINKLNVILENLVSRIANPRGVNYEIHYVNDETFNVFTLGGHIIFFKGMYDFCKSDDEIASIISHEIAHNELGHQILVLQKIKFAKQSGIPTDLSNLAIGLESQITAAGKQKQETEADLFGMDIMYQLCQNIKHRI